jgi:hypothetical protein
MEYLKGGQIATCQNMAIEEYCRGFFSEKSDYLWISRSLNKHRQTGTSFFQLADSTRFRPPDLAR